MNLSRAGILGISLFAALTLICASRTLMGASPDMYAERVNGALDKIDQWFRSRPAAGPASPVMLSGNLLISHGSWVGGFSSDDLIAYSDALADAGAKRIDMYISMVDYFGQSSPGAREVVGKYDRLVQHIRERGLQIGMHPELYRNAGRFRSMDEVRRASLPVYQEVARRYKPDVFMVLHEPTSMQARMGFPITVQDSIDFIRETARAVKANSPDTRVGAYALGNESQYFSAWLQLPELTIMGLDIYNPATATGEAQMAKQAQAQGKAVCLQETWRYPNADYSQRNSLVANAGKSIADGQYQQVDAHWLRTFFLYSSRLRLESINPFWSTSFFYYDGPQMSAVSPDYMRNAMAAIHEGKRTETFRVVQQLARQYAGPAGPMSRR